MDVRIKKFAVTMDIKNTGVELEVQKPNGAGQLGDLIVTKSKLIWCSGRQTRATAEKAGQVATWAQFAKWMEKG